MRRAEILAEVLAHLEAERFGPPVTPAALAPITTAQAAENRQTLLDATSDDPVVVDFRERQAS